MALHVLLEARVGGALDAVLATALALAELSADVAAATCLTRDVVSLSTAAAVVVAGVATAEVSTAAAEVVVAALLVDAPDDGAADSEEDESDVEEPLGQKVSIKST